jgi:DNA anti-recombination protein RmuC
LTRGHFHAENLARRLANAVDESVINGLGSAVSEHLLQKEEVMIPMMKTSRSRVEAAGNLARTMADHNLKRLELLHASAFKSLEYMAHLAGAKAGQEVIEYSRAHYRSQLKLLGSYTGSVVKLVRKLPIDASSPFVSRVVVIF